MDEFQDTDPVQAEIVMRLAAAPDEQEGPWTDLTPEPGRLFIVGDPKQSIYRFRRADIETYAEAGKPISRQPTGSPFSSNFRSTKPLLDFVNEIGPVLLPPPEGRRYAVGYAPLDPSDTTKPGDGPAVLFLSPPAPDAGADAPEDADDLPIRRQEARAIANLLLDRFSQARKSVEPDRRPRPAKRHRAASRGRPPRGGHPVRSRRGQELLQARGGRGRRSGSPRHRRSLGRHRRRRRPEVGPLRRVRSSPSRRGRGGSPVRRPEERTRKTSPIFPAIELLLRLHRERHARPFAATLADLLASRQALAAIENGAVVHPVQGLANLERLLAFARDLDRQGLTFRDSVARLVRRTEEDAAEPAAFTEERDAVRLMTLHKAKGLEFDVVVLADFGLKRANGARRAARGPLRKGGGPFRRPPRFGSRDVRSARFSEVEAADSIRREAETRRLLYVGFTRAKEALVVSWFRKWRRNKEEGDADLALREPPRVDCAPRDSFGPPRGAGRRSCRPTSRAPAPPAAAAEREEPIDVAAEMAAAESSARDGPDDSLPAPSTRRREGRRPRRSRTRTPNPPTATTPPIAPGGSASPSTRRWRRS